jgi:hypothetical protein
MPIFVNNELYDPNKNAQDEKRAAAERPVITNEPVVEVVAEVEHNETNSVNHHTVVIGGKEKKIAKNSAYLIDMITIEK